MTALGTHSAQVLHGRVCALLGRCGNIVNMEWNVRLLGIQVTLQVLGKTPCADSGELVQWSGRKWLLSPHMTDSEIVQTWFAALKMAQEHELRKHFTFDGERIFDLHWDIEKLRDARRDPGSISTRMTVAPAPPVWEEAENA